MSVQIPDTLQHQHAEDLWEAIHTHLGDTTPHAILGVAENAKPEEIQKAYHSKTPLKTTGFVDFMHELKQGKVEAVVENGTAAERLNTAYRVLTHPVDAKIYKHWLEQKAEFTRRAAEEARAALPKLSIRNPVVLMGAIAAGVGGALLGASATKRISSKRDEGGQPDAADRAQQALGFAAATAAISAAIMMWNASSKGRG